MATGDRPVARQSRRYRNGRRRVINALASRNQIEGGVVMGIGMALLEQTSYDWQSGAPINSNYAEYVIPVNADVPPLEVHFLDYPN